MKILYITPSFQHPTMRGPTRCYHFMRELSQRHRITLLSLNKDEITPEARDEITSYTERFQTFNFERLSGNSKGLTRIARPLTENLSKSQAIGQMKRAFWKLVREEAFDLVLFHGKSLFSVIENWHTLPLVVDFCDATSMRIRQSIRYAPPARRLLLMMRYRQMRRIERKLVQMTPHLAFISCRDRDAVLGPRNGARIVPIGVDQKFWTRRTHRPANNCLIFTGVMSYKPNEDAALYLIREILPLVRRFVSDAHLMIVGRDPSPVLQQEALKNEAITVTGFVEDLRTYLEKASLFVAPLRYASGVQNKVLEAMAMEVPVVSSSVVAAGLYFDRHGDPPLYVADGARQFAETVVRLLKRSEECARLACEGRQFVQEHFDWSRNAKTLEELCLEALNHQEKK